MNRLLRTITAPLGNAMHRVARARTREALLRQSDRTLADAGFSRELLLAGVDAWPWRVDHAAADARDAALLAERRRAVIELRAMNDRELDDLGIARIDIPRVVEAGRPGIDTGIRHDESIAA